MQKEITQQLFSDGFVILKNTYSEETLSNMRSLTSDIIKHAEKGLIDPFSAYYLPHREDQGVLYDLYQRHPEFQQFMMNKKVLDVLQGALGKNIYLYENSLIYKPKGRQNGVPWHQDFISRPTEPLKYIVWTALDDTNKENGAVKVIPGSHKDGFQPWYRVKGETHHDRVKPEIVERQADKITYANMEAGDVLIFNMLLLHASDEVDTDLPRRAYRCSYQSADEGIFVPRGAPVIVRGGQPTSMGESYSMKKQSESRPLHKRIAKKVGSVLEKYGAA